MIGTTLVKRLRRTILPSVVLALLLVFTLPVVAYAVPLFTGPYEPQNWQMSGPGTQSVEPASGPTKVITFKYNYDNSWYDWYTWNFTNTAGSTETYNFDWYYAPFHSWFRAQARLYVFADGPSGRTRYSLWDGYGYTEQTGSSAIQVNQGYT